MRTTIGQSNFTRGEVSPLLQGRTDQEVYKSSVSEALNCVIVPHGPLSRRTGLEYIAETKDSSGLSTLIKYRLTSDHSYILEFGHLYIRFYTERGQIVSGMSPLELVSPYTASEVYDLQTTQSGANLFIAHPNHAPQVLTRSVSGTWSIKNIPLYPPPTYESGWYSGTSITPGATTGIGVAFTTPVGALLVGDIGRQIINDTGTGRASITSWTSTTLVTATILEAFPSTSPLPAGGWHLDVSPLTTLTPSGTSVGSIVNISSPTDTFRGEDVINGKYVSIHGGVIRLTSFTDAKNVSGEVQKQLTSSAASAIWSLETPSWGVQRGYPKAVAVFEQRLFFGGSKAEPVTIWGSSSGDPYDFGVGALDADAVEFDLNSGSSVSWMASNRELVVGGDSIEVSVSSGQNSALTPSSIMQRTRTPHGANAHQPVELPNEVLFIQKSGTKIRSMLYDFSVDSYNADDITLISEHIFSTGCKQLAYAQNPYPIIYTALGDGNLAATTYSRSPQVLGTSIISTDGEIERVATVQDGGVDDVYVIVKRTIGGSVKRYVEIFAHEDGTGRTDVYSDSAKTFSQPKIISGITNNSNAVVTSIAHGFSNGDSVLIRDVSGMIEVNDHTFTISGVTANTFNLGVDSTAYGVYTSSGVVYKRVLTISGLTHLEGKTVQVKSDGATHPDCTVSSGSISLQFLTAQASVGLKYRSSITTLPAEFSIGQGTTMYSQRSRWPRPVLKVLSSAIPSVNGQFLPARNANDYMDIPVPLFSGNLEFGPTIWGSNGQLQIAVDAPYPMTLIGIFGTIEGGVK